jgi:hypothetical protein
MNAVSEAKAANNARKMWADKIAAAWRRNLDGIFEVGNLLIKAKAELAHGKYLQMVRTELPFGERVAQMLVAIAKWDNRRSIKAKHASHLPHSLFVLYPLSRLADADFDEFIASGEIDPEMDRHDAEHLREQIELEKEAEAEEADAECQSSRLVIADNQPAAPTEPRCQYYLPPQRPAAERVDPLTGASLADISRRHRAADAVQALVDLARRIEDCELEAVVQLLIEPINIEKLKLVRRGIELAIRIKGALDGAGLRGNPILRVIEGDHRGAP